MAQHIDDEVVYYFDSHPTEEERKWRREGLEFLPSNCVPSVSILTRYSQTSSFRTWKRAGLFG